jgi:hypothetical protein
MNIDDAINKLLDRIEALEQDIINIYTMFDDLDQANSHTPDNVTQKISNLKVLTDTGIAVEDAMKIAGLDNIELSQPVKSKTTDIDALLETLAIDIEGYSNAKEDGKEDNQA